MFLNNVFIIRNDIGSDGNWSMEKIPILEAVSPMVMNNMVTDLT